MSYVHVYSTRINWENEPSIVSPINATNLNKMDYALKAMDDTFADWDITKANESDMLLALKDVSYDTDTGEFVFTWFNGTTTTIDLNIEKIPVSFSMDANGVITMTTEDGTTYTADVGALIKTYTFTDSSEIDFTVTTDASGNKTVTAGIVAGSIDGTKLVPNYLADCTAAKTGAENAKDDAEDSAEDAEAWAVGTRGGVPVPSTDPAYENNAEYWAHHTSASLVGLSDVNVTNPQDKQALTYDANSGEWINGQATGGGSTIVVTTTESPLFGQTVTITDGVTTLSETFDSSGSATFRGVTMTGNLTIACLTASTSLNVPYFGNYTAVVSSFSASITVTYTGGTCTCVGNGESYTASGSPYTFTVHGAATYTITVTIDGVSKTDTVTITTDGQTATSTIEFGTINVTYDNDFRGVTITCVNGGTTISKVAPAGGNTMVFYPPTTGSWTISGTVSSDTYYSSPNPVVVSSLSTSVSATLETIPDGSTTTPTDDIQKWLACAGIKDKSYTTLTEVLSDSETFNALLGDSNACAYMARSTTWAVGLVPKMTSNTTPSGTASSNSPYSGNEPYKAFDDDISTYAFNNNGSSGAYWYFEYDFPSDVTVQSISCIANTASSSIPTYTAKLQVYDENNATWNDILTDVSMTIYNTSNAERRTFSAVTGKKFRLYGAYQGTGGYWISGVLVSLQFYGYDGGISITESQYAMSMIGQYDVCCDALLGNATWASAIVASAYADYVLTYERGLVPVMTSNTTPSGEASASTYYGSGYEAYKAFDGNNSTSYAPSNSDNYSNLYIGYEFATPQIVRGVHIKTSADHSTQGRRIASFKIIGYDGSAWVDVSDTITRDAPETYNSINNSTAYQSYRIRILSGTSDIGNNTVETIQFYNFDSGEYIHGTNNESAYYLDGATQTPIVDPSTLSAGTYTFGSTVAKDPSDLTADYTKTIRITPNTKEIVLRPDKTLYWWGYEGAILEDMSSANGWAVESGYPYNPPVHNDYDIKLTYANSQNINTGVGSKIPVTFNSANMIVEILHVSYNNAGSIRAAATKSYTPGDASWVSETGDTPLNADKKVSLIPQSTTTRYVYAFMSCGSYNAGTYREYKVKALWYE